MGYSFIRYYAIKDSLRFIHSNITYMQDTSNQMLFKYALFWDIDEYYKLMSPFKRNPYQITTKIHNQFEVFLKEILHQAYVHASLEEQLFCYYLIISYIVDYHLNAYVDSFVTKKKKKSYIDQMLETYFFNKNENLKLYKINIADYFFDSFELNQYDIALLDKPIKRQFGFFCTKNYYLECYTSAKFYFDHLARSKTGIKKPLYYLYDFLINIRKTKKKAKTFLYPKHLDTTTLNLTNDCFQFNNQDCHYSIDELYQSILKDSRRACEAMNSYFLNDEYLKPLENFFQRKKNKDAQ